MRDDRLGVFAKSAAIALLVTLALSTRVWSSETVLHDFAGSDGSQPYGGLVSDSKGNLYGTTSAGGAHGAGTVFELVYQGGTKYREEVLYSFTGGSDGGFPTASLVFDNSLNLYGTTELGGTGNCSDSGCGVVFELLKQGSSYKETVLYQFTGGSDGGLPIASVILDASDNLYSTTTCGGSGTCASGAGGAGVVFELLKQGSNYTETVLYQFTGGSDGGLPIASVVRDSAGNLYGTTEFGGNEDCGGSGCGVVFELIKKDYKVLYRFTGLNDGGEPSAPVTLDKLGNLYGTTTCGGSSSCAGGNGVVFELVKSGASYHHRVLHTFLGSDGAEPTAGLAFDSQGRYLYGTTFKGGSSDLGTAFRITNSMSGSSLTLLHSFRGGSDGAYPFASLGLGEKGGCTGRCWVGTTVLGGIPNSGTAFRGID